ncbi:MAG: outer membrane lipoprotein carrier protein LolA [Steroidobacterales bacterium]
MTTGRSNAGVAGMPAVLTALVFALVLVSTPAFTQAPVSAPAGATTATGAVGTGAPSGAATLLDRYFEGLKTMRCEFQQRIVDARGQDVEAGAGVLLVQRPGRFRWEYAARNGTDPAGAVAAGHSAVGDRQAGGGRGQILVADGRNLWFYDRELMQVTVKPVTAALSATPMALLSGSDAELHAAFEIGAAPAHDGLEWVQVVPRNAEADFSRAQLGFKSGQLVRMVIDDKLGQILTLDLIHSQRNVTLAAAEFRFQPPAGADVIGTPES